MDEAKNNMKMCLMCSPIEEEISDTDVRLHQRDALHVTDYSYGRVHWSKKMNNEEVEKWNKLLKLGHG